MQEIAILLSSLAGVATAAAVKKIPRNKARIPSLSANFHIKNQINSLKIEKDILTKTISRLYQADMEYSKIQRDKLLLKYQHQLGIILTKLEKLEEASHHPDLGPIGDGLITLMDQKLSSLDDRLYELSSKIQTNNEFGKPEKKVEKIEGLQEIKQKESEKKVEKITLFNFDKPKTSNSIVIPPSKQRQSFELTTLTKLPRKEPKFPLFDEKQVIKPKEEIISDVVEPKPQVPLGQKPDLVKEVSKITEHKALPSPNDEKPKSFNYEDDFDDSDDDDLDKIKGDIMRVLSRLEQAEVE